MIPCKLALKNFLSYGESVPPLDLEGIHVACLCGANGNGKSALLDALTWALWGRARDTRDNDELIRMHRQEMEVSLEFLASGDRYRVLRRHSRPSVEGRRQARTDLELQLWDGAAFRPITGATMRETQAKIVATLRLDYESFVNSVYLVQGQADRFSLKRPAERKELLASILGLSVYEQLESQARARVRELAGSIGALEGRRQELEGELASRAEAQQEHSRAETAVAELEADLQQTQSQADRLRAQAEAVQLQRERLRELQEQARRAQGELNDLEVQARWHQEQITTYEAATARAAETASRFALLQTARQEYEALNQRLAALLEMQRSQGELKQSIQRARAAVEQKLAVAASQAQQAREQAGRRLPLERDLAAARVQQKALAALEGQLQEQDSLVADLAAAGQVARAELARLAANGKGVGEKLELLDHAHIEAQCPLCGQELDAASRASLHRKLQDEQQSLRDQSRQLDAEAKARESRLDTARKSAEALRTRLQKEAPALERRLGSLQDALASAGEAAGRAATLASEVADLEQRLESGDYAPEAQREEASLRQQIAAIGYDPKAHELLRRRGEELAPAEEAHRRLQEAERLLPEKREALRRVESQAADRRRAQVELAARISQLEREVAAQATLERELAAATAELATLQKRQGAALAWRGQLQERLRVLEGQAREREAVAAQLARAQEDQLTHELLAQAFGKGGIPAYIIEGAVPEIEAEANLLLARMTDNRMHLDIQTQREKKGGGAVETLDIRVSDELGTRPYELFSGGETFRVNFALRIALSKLLARRAGAPLPTLIIDEGFGTQDGAGRERLIEAINAIQDDFQRILVITHLDDIRDAFPVQIEVTKTEEGSMLAVR